ncbi:hypothetical protein GCK32_006017 [Trichostrongylus colubriformis]|uniref:Saposin B-type domain-containing protein n=1 Tax=Trichostrongylus colubriformis TaxID=6319 RepID=A0AAN8FL07_TRICO
MPGVPKNGDLEHERVTNMNTFLHLTLMFALLYECYCDAECKRTLCDKCRRSASLAPVLIKKIEAKGETHDLVKIGKRIYCKKNRPDRHCLKELCKKMDKAIEKIKKDPDPEKICKYIALC